MRQTRGGRWIARTSLLAALLLGVFAFASSVAFAAATDDDVRRVAKQLRCPVCESVSVADSPSELAGQMRGVIRSKLEAGQSDQQILDYFVAAYGDSVLLEPPRRGLALGAWLGPAIGLLAGLAILVLLLRSWLRAPARPLEGRANGTAAGSAEGAPELDRARDELDSVRRSLAG